MPPFKRNNLFTRQVEKKTEASGTYYIIGIPATCFISFWYQAFKREDSKGKAMQPAADLGHRSILIRVGYVCFPHVELSAVQKMMGVITSILPLRKVKCREMTWQPLRARLVASKSTACLSRVYATFTRLYGSLKPAVLCWMFAPCLP